MSITADEVNFMIYRYLQETAHEHTAFTFAHEARLARSSVALAQIPSGLLTELLQKGLQYAEMEREIVAGNSDPDVPAAPKGLTTIFNVSAAAQSATAEAFKMAKGVPDAGGGRAADESSASMADDSVAEDQNAAERRRRTRRYKLLDCNPVLLVQRPMSSVAATW